MRDNTQMLRHHGAWYMDTIYTAYILVLSRVKLKIL
jgi:hypothetical protein